MTICPDCGCDITEFAFEDHPDSYITIDSQSYPVYCNFKSTHNDMMSVIKLEEIYYCIECYEIFLIKNSN